MNRGFRNHNHMDLQSRSHQHAEVFCKYLMFEFRHGHSKRRIQTDAVAAPAFRVKPGHVGTVAAEDRLKSQMSISPRLSDPRKLCWCELMTCSATLSGSIVGPTHRRKEMREQYKSGGLKN